jgi:preprotein translocase subunit SecB
MAAEEAQKNKSTAKEEYNRFIREIGLEGVYLVESENESCTPQPDEESLPLEIETNFEPLGFEFGQDGSLLVIFTKVEAVFRGSNDVLAKVDVVFAARYVTVEEPSSEVVNLFVKRNLHLHVWPYAREYVQSTLSRFGWQAFALPPMVQVDRIES